MDPITVLLVDDHTIAREGLRAMLETNPQIRVVGEAADGPDALVQIASLQPQVVLMDIKMSGPDGLETTRRLKSEYATISVIMLTNHDEVALVVDAVRSGAGGYLLKDATRDLLFHTIAAVANGGVLLNAPLLRKALSNEAGQVARPVRPPVQVEGLTDRDRLVLRLMAEGETNKEIGDHFGFAEVTVKKIVQGIIAKLHASDRTHAAITAMRLGLIE